MNDLDGQYAAAVVLSIVLVISIIATALLLPCDPNKSSDKIDIDYIPIHIQR